MSLIGTALATGISAALKAAQAKSGSKSSSSSLSSGSKSSSKSSISSSGSKSSSSSSHNYPSQQSYVDALTRALGTVGTVASALTGAPNLGGIMTGIGTALTADTSSKNDLPSKKTAQTIWDNTTGSKSSGSSSSGSSSSGSSGTSTTPTPSPTQTIGAPKTDIDVEAGTPSTTSTTSTTPEAMTRTSAGFAQYVSPIASVPTSDELYELYKQMTGGQENEAVRQYLNSADFQSVLGGQIPLWMQTDPVWRVYLQRLGLWKTSPRISAMQRYLNSQR